MRLSRKGTNAGNRVMLRLGTTGVLCGIALCLTLAASAQHDPRVSARPTDADTAEGRRIFESRCAACHGLDGRGAERAPDIATRASVRARSDADLSRIIRNGSPEPTGEAREHWVRLVED